MQMISLKVYYNSHANRSIYFSIYCHYFFLQDWRSTLIPAISVPVAILGTFFFLSVLVSHLLTLFCISTCRGIVVDDAIVVVEAVHAKWKLENTTLKNMGDISSAIITLVMSAVLFLLLISGSAGVFYKQFGLTLAVSIVLSAINALTLSPALCAIF
jgi:HAE1 family hydrophobic/amphiphilic exporter-1